MNHFREANTSDATFLIPLVTVSSGGVWPALWRAYAQEGESVEACGARYIADVSNKLSIRNTVIAESDGHRIGAMIIYQEGNQSADEQSVSLPLPKALEEALQPYRELSDPESLFVAELCLLPASRGQGVGTRFLEIAKDAARERGLPRVSLRVFGENVGAVRLYRRNGFEVTGERPVVAYPDLEVSGSVLSMSCAV